MYKKIGIISREEKQFKQNYKVFNDEIVKVINKYNRPFKTSTFFWTQVILLIPIVNIVLLFAWAFRKNSNENRKAYARSILLWISVVILALFIGTIVLWALGYPIDIGYWKNELKLAINSL